MKGFLYPPSCALIFRPLAALDRHQAALLGLVVVALLAWVAVGVAAAGLGFKPWGFVAAITLFLLTFTQAITGELSLENASVLCALGLALFYLLALRGQWTAAGVVLGLSLAVKPLLVAVVLVLVIERRWKALLAALGVPAALNFAGMVLVPHPTEVFAKLPSLLDRSGSGVNFNSAWVDVARTLALPDGISILLRLVTVALAIAAALLARQRLSDPRLRLVTTTSALLLGLYLAGTLSEYHFMITLVPLALTAALPGSPVRNPSGVLGVAWTMGALALPASVLAVDPIADHSAFRAIGMGMVLVTLVAVLARRPQVRVVRA